MTISGYSSAIVDTMLGWLKGFANWVLRLFNLAGSVSVSPLLWLSHNWLRLLILFLIIGIAADVLVWLVRWRPHWVWFRKERVIVSDDHFFSDEGLKSQSEWEEDLEKNWHEHDYVVASTVVKRQEPQKTAGESPRIKKRTASDRGGATPRRRTEGTKVKRHTGTDDAGAEKSAGARGKTARAHGHDAHAHRPDNIFASELQKRDVSDSYEDEVFNVNNLPVFDEFSQKEQAARKPRRRRR